MKLTFKRCLAFALASLLLISGLLAGGFGSVNAKATDTKPMSEILPGDFAKATNDNELPADAWKTMTVYAGAFITQDGNRLRFYNFTQGDSFEVPITALCDDCILDGGYYRYADVDGRQIQFIMDGGLCRITLLGAGSALSADYECPEYFGIFNGTKQEDESANHGYITIDKERAVMNATVTVTAHPSAGYKLKDAPKYELSGQSYEGTPGENSQYFFSMPNSEITITAEFEEDLTPKYGITVSSNDAQYGSAIATVDGNAVTEAAKDATVELRATPNTGYVFDHWNVEEGGVQISENTRFTMPERAVRITAVFMPRTTPPDPNEYRIKSIREGASLDFDDESLVAGIKNDSDEKAYIHYNKQTNEVYITKSQNSPAEGCQDCIHLTSGTKANINFAGCGFQLGTPIKVVVNEFYEAPAPDDPINKIPAHVHNYVWKEKTAPTRISDGLEVEECTICGDTRNSCPISAFGYAINYYAMPMIKAAKSGQTITFEFGEWNSFPNKLLQAIAQRSSENITFVFHYKWNKQMQEIVIPAGTTFDTTLDWYGPATMESLFGENELNQ